MSTPFIGEWRIIKSDLCDDCDLDLLGAATIRVGEDGLGSFNVLAISAGIDCRYESRGGMAGVPPVRIGHHAPTPTTR